MSSKTADANLEAARRVFRWDRENFPEIPMQGPTVPPGHRPLDRLRWSLLLLDGALAVSANTASVLVGATGDQAPPWLRRTSRGLAVARRLTGRRSWRSPASRWAGQLLGSRWVHAVDGLHGRVLPAVGGALSARIMPRLGSLVTEADDLLEAAASLGRPATSYAEFEALLDPSAVQPPAIAVGYEQKAADFFDRAPVQGNNPVNLQAFDPAGAEAWGLGPPLRKLMEGPTAPRFVLDYGRLLSEQLQMSAFPEPKEFRRPRVLFGVRGGLLHAVAIQPDVKQPTLLLRDQPGWAVARSYALLADQLHHVLVSHFPRVHFVMEALLVGTHRALPPGHPIHRLLVPHFEGTLSINRVAAGSFLDEAGAYRVLLATTLRSTHREVSRARREFDFTAAHFPRDLAARGVADAEALPDYPYRDDGLLYWEAIHRWISDYVALHYDDDDAVRSDGGLRSWTDELQDPARGAIRNVAPGGGQFTSREDLVEALSSVLFTASAHHAAIQFPLSDIDVFTPACPNAMYLRSDSDSVPARLAPLYLALFQHAFNYFGKVITLRLGDYEVGWFDRRTRPALRRFRAAVRDAERTIEERNRGRAHPYATLEVVPQSVEI